MESYEELEEPIILSDYEIERGKPIPSRNHSLVQTRLGFLLMRDYDAQFSIPSELELEFLPKNAVPDLCIYPKMQVDFLEDDVIRMTNAPLTAVEILSPRQVLEDVVAKARKQYFPNGVKSVWVILPSLKTVVIISPDLKPTYFTEGKLFDPAINVSLLVSEIFQA